MQTSIVTISTGKLRGKISKNINNNPFYSFQGVPYAQPPIEKLRFKAPIPVEAWSGIRDATKEGNVCVQINPFMNIIQGDEDCLTLNVFTSSLSDKNNAQNKKAVMVWIHGGGFTYGSGGSELYGPEILMTEDIVLVTINYRIGILGFLSLEDPDLGVTGNMGLRDIVLALKWVKNNISHFCGDPNNVTIFGESAGGAAVHYLILSPMTNGLFHKAILQSGCSLNVWARGRRSVIELAQVLKLHTTDERKILKTLENLPVHELFAAASKLRDPFVAYKARPFGPVIEKKPDGAFLVKDPVEIIRSGKYNHVPMMVGYTTREGMIAEIFQKLKPFKPVTNFEEAIPYFLKLEPGSEISKLVAKEIKEFYYENENPSSENKDKYYLLQSDSFFVRELLTTVNLHKKTSLYPIFLFRVSVETDLNIMKTIAGIEEPGVSHSDDLGYLFKNFFTPDIKPGSDEEISMKRFVKLWTNFAKYGNPNEKEKSNIVDVEWNPVSHKEMHFLDIGKTLTMGRNPESARMAFWEYIFKINPVHKL